MKKSLKLLCWCFCLLICVDGIAAQGTHHYVFFNRDRERIRDAAFLETKALEGAQLKYTWRELEPEQDRYDFSAIREDLQFLTSKERGFLSRFRMFLSTRQS